MFLVVLVPADKYVANGSMLISFFINKMLVFNIKKNSKKKNMIFSIKRGTCS